MEKYSGPIEKVESVEKVKLTYEQAEAIEIYKALRYTIETFVNTKQSFGMSFKSLKSLSVDDFASALLIGYEIEQSKFQPGDKVLVFEDNRIFILDERKLEHDRSEFGNAWKAEGVLGWIGEKQFRHATPEEIYWLETLGREKVGDYYYGDILTSSDHIPFVISNKTDTGAGFIDKRDADEFRRKFNLKGLLPAESYKAFPKEQSHER